VRTDGDYLWFQVGVATGDRCRWIWINQGGQEGESDFQLLPDGTVKGTWWYRSTGVRNECGLARPGALPAGTLATPEAERAALTVGARAERDVFKSEADFRAWLARTLKEFGLAEGAAAAVPPGPLPAPPPPGTEPPAKLIATLPAAASIYSVSPDGTAAAWTERAGGVEAVTAGGKKGANFLQIGVSHAWMKGNVLAYTARAQKWHVVVGEKMHDGFDEIEGLVVSPDGRHVAYLGNTWTPSGGGRSLTKQTIVIDGLKREYPSAEPPTFHPVSNSVVYKAHQPAGGGNFVKSVLVTGTTVREVQEIESTPAFSANGKSMAYIGTGPWAGARYALYLNGEPATFGHYHARHPAVAPGGKGWAFVAFEEPDAQGSQKQYVVHNGKEGAKYDMVRPPILSADGASVAYLAVRYENFRGAGCRVVQDDAVSEEFDWDYEERDLLQPVFAPAGTALAYRGSKGGKPFVAVGRRQAMGYDWYGRPGFTSDGKAVVYAGVRGREVFWDRLSVP
jgi:hypothetical protein